jgi:hypothetical protein
MAIPKVRSAKELCLNSFSNLSVQCYRLLAVFGLAEELIVNDDPEFQVSSIPAITKGCDLQCTVD